MRLDTFRPYFIYNGIDSRSMGIWVTAMPPVIRAEKRMETVEVGGRSGSLHLAENAYNSYMRTMECAILDRQRIDEIAAWLDGNGTIIFSDELDKVYKIHIVNTISIEQMMRRFQSFVVTMDTYPFKYSVNAIDDEVEFPPKATQSAGNIGDDDMVLMSSRLGLSGGSLITRSISFDLFNRGTIFSEPIIELDITDEAEEMETPPLELLSLAINPLPQPTTDYFFYLNDRLYQFQNLTKNIIINSEMGEVYTVDGENANNLYIADEFPVLQTGVNQFTFAPTFQRVKVIPNWRWL